MSAAPIEPGMWMEALRDERPYYTKGSVWRVDRAWPQGPVYECVRDEDCQAPCVIFAGMQMPPDVIAACACGFKPIYRERSETFAINQYTVPAPAENAPEHV